MADAHSIDDVAEASRIAKQNNIPIYILGGGSNTIARDEGYPGLVLRNRIPGFEVISETPSDATIKIGGGENWDKIVQKTVDLGLSGIECLSSIPGTAGAAPVQNIGAYGQEISETLEQLEAYDLRNQVLVSMTNDECGFSYRDSIFRSSEIGRYFISSITIRLYKSTPTPPFYGSLQKYLDDNNITHYTVASIRDAVTKIRMDRLPDPKLIPNSGSFFKNTIVEDWQLKLIQENHPDVPFYELATGSYKVPTGWLIEQTGMKGQLLDGIRVYEKNALVLANESASSYQSLANARETIVGAVRKMFGVEIKQEPLEIVSN